MGCEYSRMRIAALLAVAFFASQQPNGYCEHEPKCKENPKIVAKCFTVHARANLGADSVPIYLWPIGTKWRLGVTGGPTLDDSVEPIYPKNLQFELDSDSIYGDFEVCPFTKEKKDHLRLVLR
jgi:hypothetical protein